MKVTIDRYEGEFVVCEKEDRSMLNVDREKIPPEAKEGDILIIEEDTISIDAISTRE